MKATSTGTSAILRLAAKGPFRARDLDALGVPRAYLRRLVDRGLLEQAARGLYTAAEAPVTELRSLVEVVARVPHATICLLSALQVHELTTEVPHAVWVLIETHARAPAISSPKLKVIRAAGTALKHGVDESGLVEQFRNAVAIWDVPATDIVREVTESSVMDDPSLSAIVLGQLRDHGFGISIDDFGIGYSSFAYLKRFPATELKIDQEFVLDIGGNARSARLVHSMIDLAHHLGLVAVAEGVEDEATLARLRDMGCDLAQGFLFGRPQPAAEFVTALGASP